MTANIDIEKQLVTANGKLVAQIIQPEKPIIRDLRHCLYTLLEPLELNSKCAASNGSIATGEICCCSLDTAESFQFSCLSLYTKQQ